MCGSTQVETIRSNVIGCLLLADITREAGIHMTYFGTGCIFHYDKDFPQDSGKGFKESDTPNFTGSYYSHTKVGTLQDKTGSDLLRRCWCVHVGHGC